RELFSRRDDKVGELLTLAQLIFYHWVAAGTFNAGAGLLSRAEALFTEVREELPPIATVLVAKNLAAGFCYFKTDMARASLYSNLALQMARRHQIKNCIASLLLIQGYEHLMLGHRTLNLQELEEAQELIDDPQVGSLNRLSLRLMQLNDLEMHGDFDNFAHQEAGLINLFGRNAIRGSAIGPLLSIWHAAILVAGDKLDEARQRLTVELEGRAKGLPPHLQSQLLQWLAYILALAGDKKRALTTAAESAALRAEAGGPFFMTVNDLLLGATHALLDRADVAETLLDHALSRALQFGIDYCAAAALLQRASLRLKKGGVSAARDDLTTGLRLMRQHGYHHFWGWTPQTVTPLLAAAVRDRIERSYARKLAAEKLGVMLLNDGSAIPLLAFRTFGRLTLAVDDRIVLSAEDLTPAQRELLALLIAAPGQRLGQEQIQLALWPESPPEKARSKFDSLLLRLRKTMGDAIKPHRMQHYLSLKKGILCLEGVRIDANDCARLARQGLHHCRRQEWWQAGNAFHGAASLWRGCFLPDIFGAEPVDDYRLELHTLFVELSTQWGHHLVDQGNLDEAARVIAAALKCQKGNLELTSLLHGLYLKNNNPLAAQQVLREFEALLRAEDYQADEITALLASVTSPPSQPLT
ncbi:MAG: winged helix-turn-helix domain-containing protein, partial [Desulfobulbaceae bacterium]|nr:winged helix-turn-helix domain-containing protein [Desulfobulbaceae bacterium]